MRRKESERYFLGSQFSSCFMNITLFCHHKFLCHRFYSGVHIAMRKCMPQQKLSVFKEVEARGSVERQNEENYRGCFETIIFGSGDQ
jgi:hypothetical protein